MSSRLTGLLGEHMQNQALAEAQGHLAEGLCSGKDKLVKLLIAVLAAVAVWNWDRTECKASTSLP